MGQHIRSCVKCGVYHVTEETETKGGTGYQERPKLQALLLTSVTLNLKLYTVLIYQYYSDFDMTLSML